MQILKATPQNYDFSASIFVSYASVGEFVGDTRPYDIERIACLLAHYFRIPLKSPETGNISFHMNATVINSDKENRVRDEELTVLNIELHPQRIINFLHDQANNLEEHAHNDAVIFVHDDKVWVCDTDEVNPNFDVILLDYNKSIPKSYWSVWKSMSRDWNMDARYITGDTLIDRVHYTCEISNEDALDKNGIYG